MNGTAVIKSRTAGCFDITAHDNINEPWDMQHVRERRSQRMTGEMHPCVIKGSSMCAALSLLGQVRSVECMRVRGVVILRRKLSHTWSAIARSPRRSTQMAGFLRNRSELMTAVLRLFSVTQYSPESSTYKIKRRSRPRIERAASI